MIFGRMLHLAARKRPEKTANCVRDKGIGAAPQEKKRCASNELRRLLRPV
jgi:hypothetical protein